MNPENTIIISAVIEIIALICFFILCFNISKIRKKLIISDNFPGMFAMYIALGDKEKARKLLYNAISKESEFFASFCNNGNNSTQRSILKRKYKPYLNALDIEFDFEIVDKFIQSREE